VVPDTYVSPLVESIAKPKSEEETTEPNWRVHSIMGSVSAIAI